MEYVGSYPWIQVGSLHEQPGQMENSMAAITQAGGWKSTRLPLQYAEKINAARSGIARATAASGRDDADQMYK